MRRGVCLLNAGQYELAAAAFLRDHAEKESPYAPHLIDAAEAYGEELRILDQAMREAPWSFDAEDRRRQMADRGLRARMAQALRAAKVKDQLAVHALELALAEVQ